MERSDLIMTLATNPKLRSGSIQEERDFLKERGWLWYPVSGKPQQRVEGVWLYFVREGYVVGRAKISEAVFIDGNTKYERTYTGVEIHKPGWRLKIRAPMQTAKKPLPIKVLGIDKGFQNFRYTLRLKNSERLADAFKAS